MYICAFTIFLYFFFRAKADASAAKQKQDAGKKRQRVDTVDPLDPTGRSIHS